MSKRHRNQSETLPAHRSHNNLTQSASRTSLPRSRKHPAGGGRTGDHGPSAFQTGRIGHNLCPTIIRQNLSPRSKLTGHSSQTVLSNHPPGLVASAAGHLAQIEVGDEVEGALARDVERLLDQRRGDERAGEHQLDQPRQFRAGAAAMSRYLSVNALRHAALLSAGCGRGFHSAMACRR